jgi:hypothetical protein
MARQYIPVLDLTSEGLKENDASTSKLWTKLENVRRGTGGWKKRPGTDRIDGAGLPAVTVGDPKLFIVYKHPSSEPLSEIIRPTGTGNYDAWTNSEASNWQGVDEATADNDTSYVEEATKGDKTSFTFGSLAGTFNAVSSLRVSILAKRDTSIRHDLVVKTRISGVDYSFGSGSVTVDANASNDYVLLNIDSSTNPATSLPWTPTEVDALEIILEKGEGLNVQTEDQALTVPAAGFTTAKTVANVASAVSWGTTPTTTAIITWIEANSDDIANLEYELWNGSVRVQDDLVLPSSDGTNTNTASNVDTVSHPFAPLTGTGTIFRFSPLPLDDGTNNRPAQTISSITLRREGSSVDDTGTLRVSQVFVTVEGDGNNSIRNSLLMLTSSAFLRVAEDLSTYTDVQGTASAPTASVGESWDHAVFNGQLYVTNGKDDLFEYPTGADVFDQFSSQPVGHALASYGSRLFQGDVTESSVRSLNRIRWSAINNATNWSDASSGNLELDETIGKVVAMRPLVEGSQDLVGVLSVYKTTGIYHVKATGIAAEPFERKLMDSSAGCIARGTVVGVSDEGGRDSHIFLGQVGGTLNVLRWNGSQIEQIGNDIVNILEETGDIVNLEKAIATVDTFGNYLLMFPTSNSSYLKDVLVYNFKKGLWSTWNLQNTTALGTWVPNTGRPITVLGRPDSFAYKLDDTIATDDIESTDTLPYTATIESGDLTMLPQEPWKRGVLERTWFYFKQDTTDAVWEFDGSYDGGVTRRLDEDSTSQQKVFSGNSGKGVQLQRFDSRIPGRKHRIRLQSKLDDGKPELLQMILELEDHGIDPT